MQASKLDMENSGMGIDVSVAEQINRLAAVDLGEASKLKKVRKSNLLPKIDSRLVVWGEWVLSNNRSYDSQAGGSMLGALMDSCGELIRGTNPSAGSMPDDVYDTAKAVEGLGDQLRMVVEQQYQNLSATPVQRAEECGCSAKTFYRRLAKAHNEILFMLKTPDALRVTSDSRSKILSRCAKRC